MPSLTRVMRTAVTGAVLLAAGGAALAQTPPKMKQMSREDMMTLFQACKDDYRRYCKDVEPGDGRIARCMGEHRENLSEQCRVTVRDIMLK
ncbi:cysteine rich repeat-containing protein [Acuticoccus sp. I52.16.1]|uniref:cysteine rich repeat-containing protein n=1 Tax=Acuticoccus sp. I52.16.1 TaxID=2928472 RepID=UPI001FD0E112|nr:cysteine rich repeat-containing protein [Acuticoccus sp. I52.16.1]UOM33918.1 cysteine rich repeat-containing protein [Acuticoccus sp. I52.16.1]